MWSPGPAASRSKASTSIWCLSVPSPSRCRGRSRPGRRRAGPGGVDHLRHEDLEIVAVDRRVVEAASRPVTVRVQAAAAGSCHRAGSTGTAEAADARAARGEALMVSDLVDRVGEDPKTGLRRAIVGGLQRVGLLPAAIGVEDEKVDRIQADGLTPARAAFPGCEQRIEEPDGHRAPVLDPPLVNLPEPGRVGRVTVRPPGGRGIPRRMRQKQVEARRGLREHRLIDGKRVVRHVHRAEDPGVEVPVLRSPEQRERPQHLRMAAPPVGEASVPVVGGAIAVQRDAHLNAICGEQIAQALVELDAIRVNGQAEPRHRIYHGAQREQ